MRGRRVLLQKRALGAPEGNMNYCTKIGSAEKFSALCFFHHALRSFGRLVSKFRSLFATRASKRQLLSANVTQARVLSVGVIAESTLDTTCYFLVRVVFLMYPLWFIFSFFVREARPVSCLV